MDPAPLAVTRSKPPLALVRAINPVVRRLLRSRAHPLLDGAVLLLHLTGRRSSRRYDIPVGYRGVAGRLQVFTDSPWRANVRGGADIEVSLRGNRLPMRVELDEDPDRVAGVYAGRIAELGRGPAQRRLGIRIHVGRRAHLRRAGSRDPPHRAVDPDPYPAAGTPHRRLVNLRAGGTGGGWSFRGR